MEVPVTVDFRGYAPLLKAMKLVTDPNVSSYGERYHAKSPEELAMTAAEVVQRMDSCGITHMVLAGAGITNPELAEYVGAHPGRLSGIATVSPASSISGSVADVHRSYELGFRLVQIRPYIDGICAADRAYYPIYSTCEQLGMAVVSHSAMHFARGLKMEYNRPIYLDAVATDFPNLSLIASHGGWPWIPEMVALAWRHDNVYIEVSGHRAKYMLSQGSGWECLFNYLSGPLNTRVLWGSAFPVLDQSQLLDEWKRSHLDSSTVSRVLGENGQELLTKLGVSVDLMQS